MRRASRAHQRPTPGAWSSSVNDSDKSWSSSVSLAKSSVVQGALVVVVFVLVALGRGTAAFGVLGARIASRRLRRDRLEEAAAGLGGRVAAEASEVRLALHLHRA